MFLNKKKHYLSTALFFTGIINIVGSFSLSLFRFFQNRQFELLPDMTEPAVWNMQLLISFIQVFLIAVVFYIQAFRFNRYRKKIPLSEYTEIAKLQEEVNTDNVSTLSAYSIGQLMQIWAFILIGVQIVYDITMIVYRRFIMQLADMVLTSEKDLADTMVDIYNNTHGFKYLGMFIGIMLGMIVTGVFLNDKLLKIMAGVVSVIFVTAFFILEMEPISIMGHYVGVVWTSFIFHQMETVGLMLTAFYLARKYRGI